MEWEAYSLLPEDELVQRIQKAKAEKNAVLLVHNYQRMEIQRIADFLGDSLGLSRQATQTKADLIVFCGVDFMAESAKILNPEKTVLLPDKNAGCPMAAMATAEAVRKKKAEHPGAVVVSYVNTTAEVKAESNICCTSANAVNIIRSLGDHKILFVPDRNLANYGADQTGAHIIPWEGYCYVHDRFTVEDVERARAAYPEALFIAHPECRREVLALADHVASTSGMVKWVDAMSEGDARRGVILGTEVGLAHQLQAKYPGRLIVPLREHGICATMKLTNLAKVAWSIENEQYKVVVPEDIRLRAKAALDRMLSVS